MKNKIILLVSMLLPLVSSCEEKPTVELTPSPTIQSTVEPTVIPTEESTPDATIEPTVEPTLESTNYLETKYNLSFDTELSDLVLNYLLNGIGGNYDYFPFLPYTVMDVYNDCIEDDENWMEAFLIDTKQIVGYINDSTYEKIEYVDFLDIDYRSSGIVRVCPQYQKGIMDKIITYEDDPLYVSYYNEGKLPEKCDRKTIALHFIINAYEFENGDKLYVFDFYKPSYSNGFYKFDKVQRYLDEKMIYPVKMLNDPIYIMSFDTFSVSKSEIEKEFYIHFSNDKEMSFYNTIKDCIDEEEAQTDCYCIKINYDKFLSFCGIKTLIE